VMNSVVNMIFFGSLMTAMREQAANPAEMLSFMGTMGLVSLAGMAVGCCYEALFIAKMGATPGKMALSLKVVRGNGGPVDLGRAFGRYFAKILSGIILLIGYIMAGFDSQKRALHDMICDTRVIKREN